MPGFEATAPNWGDDPWWTMVREYVDEEHFNTYFLGVPQDSRESTHSAPSTPALSWSSSLASTNKVTTESGDAHLHLPNHTFNHPTSRVATTSNRASNVCIRVGLDWGNGAFQQTLEPFRVNRGAILNPIWIDTARVGLGITEGASDQGDTANEAERVLWPGSLSRWYQATYPYYVPPPSPASWNGRTSEDYTWAVALSTYDYLDIEPARHAVGHLTTWGRAAERDRTRRKVPVREDASHPGYGMTDTRYTVGSTNTVVSTHGIAIVGRDVEALAHSSTDELAILSALDDYIPGLVGLEE